MALNNQFMIDGLDVFDTYGIIFERGIFNELLKFPSRKEVFSQSWKDQDGTVRYVNNPHFESVEMNLQFVLIGQNITDYLNKLNAFRNKMLTSGYFNFDSVKLNMRFTLLYKSMQQITHLTRLSNNKVASRFVITLIDDFPTNHPNLQ